MKKSIVSAKTEKIFKGLKLKISKTDNTSGFDFKSQRQEEEQLAKVEDKMGENYNQLGNENQLEND